MRRVALYVRVSTEEQKNHGVSVENQIEELKKYCKDNNYNIVGVYNDAGISARKSYKKRPALLQLLEDCKEGKIDLILFTKLDRWFRSVADYYDVQRVLDEYGVKWRCIWEDYDTETSTGVFKVNIMLSVAQSEADRTSERIKKTFEYKKSKGEVCSGGVAYGYRIENKRWVKDKEAEPFVNEFFNTYLATLSNRLTQQHMIEIGHNISLEGVRRMLSNPAYYGGVPYVVEAYITKEQHETIVKSKKRNICRRKHDYIFSGLCYCGLCGSKMVGERTINIRKDGSEQHSIRYSCYKHDMYPTECYGSTCRESTIEEIALKALEEEIKRQVESYKFEIVDNNNISNIDALNKAKSKLKRIKDLYELGDMDFNEYKFKRDTLLAEISTLEAEPENKKISVPDNWRSVYAELDAKHKNSFWISIIERIEVNGRLATTAKIQF